MRVEIWPTRTPVNLSVASRTSAIDDLQAQKKRLQQVALTRLVEFRFPRRAVASATTRKAYAGTGNTSKVFIERLLVATIPPDATVTPHAIALH